jgi:hypothetical protein
MPSTESVPVVPVLSLLLFRDPHREQVLLGVRRSSSTSPRHPDVLSTPTMRIPMSLMQELVKGVAAPFDSESVPWFQTLNDGRTWKIGVPYSLSSVHTFAAESLIARKLGMAEALVHGQLTGELSLSAIARDLIYDDYGGQEMTVMLTMTSVLTSPVTLPTSSPSYSRLDWVETGKVGEAVATRDPLLLLPDASVWEVCLHGLCVRSAAYAIENGKE